MESPSLSALKELRIETSTESINRLDTETELPDVEAAQLSPKVDRVRHHLIPARTTTCVRAPCLKRQVSVPIASMSKELIASRLEAGYIQDRVASNPLPSSFAAPRNLALEANARHVHFNDAPPEEFFVLSGESYDRRPIKCTQGGSEFDMSLPPRSHSYNGDDSADEEASSIDEPHSILQSTAEPAPDVGFVQDTTLDNWACIKNGTMIASVGYQPRQQQSGLMASGKSLHFSALSSLQHASAMATGDAIKCGSASSSLTQAQPSAPSQKVSLPVHGFRSFGGLQNSLAPDVTSSPITEKPPTFSSKSASSPETTPPALRNFSPDATPMPSPSLHRSVGALSSVGYFGVSSGLAQSVTASSISKDDDSPSHVASPSQENVLGAMEVLRDTPASNLSAATHDFRDADTALKHLHMPIQAPSKPTSISVKVPETTSHSTPRRMGLERRAAEKDAARISTVQTSVTSPNGNGAALNAGWSSLLGPTSSPLSSRCSSVDPWSSLSSDGDGDGTESPGNEGTWISSNCTSPDLSPFEQMAETFHHNKPGLNGFASGSGSNWPEAARSSNHLDINPSQLNGAAGRVSPRNGTDNWDDELTTPKNTDFTDEAKFSSSVETVNTVSWEPKHSKVASSITMLSGISSADVSASEATTPESSRRPSFHQTEMPSYKLSPRMRSSFGAGDSGLDMDEDDSHVLRVRSLSRDGHAKKKSSKCRFCRSLRSRLKSSSTESSAPASSGGSAQITDAEGEADGEADGLASMSAATSGHQRYLTSSAEVSEMENEDDEARSRSNISQLRASVRSLSMDDWSSNAARSRSHDGSALSHLSVARESTHDRESSGSPGESCSESPMLSAVNLPMMCTCDKKREKERQKKKIRKERELERERDREWERDQARGRQKKLFGESFGDADNSCLSALDGF